MRFVKTGAIALAAVGASVIGAGAAHADQTITVTTKLASCAVTAGVGMNLNADIGKSIRVSDADYAKLQSHHCL